MSLAKAAELNHYPGPRHVLDLAAQLQLYCAARWRRSRLRPHAPEAARLGTLIVDREQELDQLFATQAVNSHTLRSLTNTLPSFTAVCARAPASPCRGEAAAVA
jgi:hypothetical protein